MQGATAVPDGSQARYRRLTCSVAISWTNDLPLTKLEPADLGATLTFLDTPVSNSVSAVDGITPRDDIRGAKKASSSAPSASSSKVLAGELMAGARRHKEKGETRVYESVLT
jgi:hypothetical protein